MKAAAIAVVLLFATVSLAQLKEPGLNSRHASAAKKSPSMGTAASTPNTAANAAALAKIEEQGRHVQSSSATRAGASSSSATAAPKTPTPAESRNKPMGSVPRRQPKANVPH